MKRLLLIDANSIIHRAFHALPPFTGPDGRPTGALYGISAMLLALLKTEWPEYAAALFDRPEPTFRDEKYKEYKAQRPPVASELVSQIIEARDLFRAFGIAVFEKAGYEADDLIATFVEKFRTLPDLQVMVLTGDRDTLQLVEGDKIVIRLFQKGVSDTVLYNEAGVMEKYGLRPGQMIDYKSLVGDASDNIKGVPGVGPKTAIEILKQYATLEQFFSDAPDSKQKERIVSSRREAELSRELVLLERHVPVEIGPIDSLVPLGTKTTIGDYFKTLGSATLLKRLAGITGAVTHPHAKKESQPPPNIQKSLF